MRKSHDIPPGEVEEFGTIIQNARKKKQSSGTRNAMRYTRTHLNLQDTKAERCNVKKLAGGDFGDERPPSNERKATLPDKHRKTNQNVRISLGVFFTKSEIIRMKITLQIEDLIHDIIKNFGTHSLPMMKDVYCITVCFLDTFSMCLVAESQSHKVLSARAEKEGWHWSEAHRDYGACIVAD